MRKEQFGVGSIVHVFNRGAHKMPIVRSDNDRWRFLKLIRYLNDANMYRNWEREIHPEHIVNNFARPTAWREPEPYVSVLAYCLQDNHFHLLLRERLEGGISKFMQRVSKSMASNFNGIYGETGSLFEGPYRAKVVEDDTYLQYLPFYIHIKNVLERFPGGITAALNDFEKAYRFACEWDFSSAPDFAGLRTSSILDHSEIRELFHYQPNFRTIAKELMDGRNDWVESENKVFTT